MAVVAISDSIADVVVVAVDAVVDGDDSLKGECQRLYVPFDCDVDNLHVVAGQIDLSSARKADEFAVVDDDGDDESETWKRRRCLLRK